MEPTQIVTAGLCALVGLSLGLLGGGGSVLMVPLFVYIAKVPVAEAIAMSLLIIGLSSAAGVLKYWNQGLVNRRLVILFIVPGIFVSFVGARAAERVPSEVLLLLFGVMMVLISLILYRKAGQGPGADGPVVCRPGLGISVSIGAAIGFLTGLLGVGGGFLIVPAIALLMKCSLHTAIGTSLAIIAVNSAAGFLGHLTAMRMDPAPTAVYLTATLAAAVVGTRAAHRFSVVLLQKAFAVMILAVGALVTAQFFIPK